MPDTKQTAHRTNGTTSSGRLTGLETASPEQWLGSNDDPDVMLSVPELTVDKITLKVKELRADVDLQARVLDLLDLRVGARVTLGEVDLDIENVSAKAMLKVRLDRVAEAIDKVMDAIIEHPELVTSALNLNVAADSELAVPSAARTVRGVGLGGLVSGVLGAQGSEPQLDALQTTAQVEQTPRKRAPAKRTPAKRAARKATSTRTTRSHK
jgi:hypothetical protein